jgi:hypothetical protein
MTASAAMRPESSSAFSTSQGNTTQCPRCRHQVEIRAKFCGSCGAACFKQKSQSQPNLAITADIAKLPNQTQTLLIPDAVSAQDLKNLKGMLGPNGLVSSDRIKAINISNQANYAERKSARQAVPAFAMRNQQISKALQQEISDLQANMIREQIFLILHWICFVVTNLVGFAIALKCYNEFIGDEMSKLMMASTPLMIINLCALCCLVPIKGTKHQIALTREKLIYARLKIEYENLM